jgi:hypothetical protein
MNHTLLLWHFGIYAEFPLTSLNKLLSLQHLRDGVKLLYKDGPIILWSIGGVPFGWVYLFG